METASAQKFAEDWITAWNDHNLPAIMGHYDDEIIFTSPFIEKLKVNKDGTIHDKITLHNYFKVALEKYPNLRFQLLHCLAGVNSVVLFYKSIDGLFSAEYMQLNTRGKIKRVVAHYSKT